MLRRRSLHQLVLAVVSLALTPFAAIEYVPAFGRSVGLAEPASMHEGSAYWVTPGVTYRVVERSSQKNIPYAVLESCEGIRIETAERVITDLEKKTIFFLTPKRGTLIVGFGERLTCKDPWQRLGDTIAAELDLWTSKKGL
jgi:hypothetical protein